MDTIARRHFLHSSLFVGTGLVLAAASASAIEPIRRGGNAHLRLSIAAYSFRQELNLKRKPKPAMTLDDFIDLAADMEVDAVELTAYYFPKTTPDYLAHLKGRCTRLGLDVSGTAVGNNFCVADGENLKGQIDSVKEWIEHSARLGAKTMRIFAGNMARDDTEEKARQRHGQFRHGGSIRRFSEARSLRRDGAAQDRDPASRHEERGCRSQTPD
jgi:sugar phosphate isomerase/epimerase